MAGRLGKALTMMPFGQRKDIECTAIDSTGKIVTIHLGKRFPVVWGHPSEICPAFHTTSVGPTENICLCESAVKGLALIIIECCKAGSHRALNRNNDENQGQKKRSHYPDPMKRTDHLISKMSR